MDLQRERALARTHRPEAEAKDRHAAPTVAPLRQGAARKAPSTAAVRFHEAFSWAFTASGTAGSARSASTGPHHPPGVDVDPRRLDHRRGGDEAAVRLLLEADLGDRAVGCARRPAGDRPEVGDQVAEPEHHPHAVDLLDRLQHVGVVTDDEVDQAAGGDRLGDAALLGGDGSHLLRSPVEADDHESAHPWRARWRHRRRSGPDRSTRRARVDRPAAGCR